MRRSQSSTPPATMDYLSTCRLCGQHIGYALQWESRESGGLCPTTTGEVTGHLPRIETARRGHWSSCPMDCNDRNCQTIN